MKALLLNPPYKPNFIRSARSTWPSISGSNWYPIFLAYAAGWLEKHQHKVKLIDALVANFSVKETLKTAKDFQPDLLILYVSTQSLKSDIAIGEKIKNQTSCQLILVGPWCSTKPEKILSLYKAVDGIVPQEFDDVVLNLANNKNKENIFGLVYRDGERIITNPKRSFLTPPELDQFPFVTKIYKDHLPIPRYYQASLLHPFVDLFTGRGCIWSQCTFCLWPATIHKGAPLYRTRKLDGVIEELKYIKKELPSVKEVFFQDDTLPAGRARQISELILKENLKLHWSCYARATLDFQTLLIMKKAGCRYLHVGYETIDPTIIKNIRKGTDALMMEKFTQNTKKAGLKVHGDFILGLPGETEKTIRKTIEWAKNLRIEGYQFFIPQPHEGTFLYHWLSKKGYLTKNGEINYPHLSYKKLNYWRFEAMRKIYFSPKYILKTLMSIGSLDEFVRLFRAAYYVIPNIISSKK